MKRLLNDIWRVASAATPVHSHLRERLLTTIYVTILVDIVASVAMLFLEGSRKNSEIGNLLDAFYWTTSQLVTISSTMENPTTIAGQFLTLALDIYAITVVSTLAGMFSAFFYHRSESRFNSSSPSA